MALLFPRDCFLRDLGKVKVLKSKCSTSLHSPSLQAEEDNKQIQKVLAAEQLSRVSTRLMKKGQCSNDDMKPLEGSLSKEPLPSS